MPINYIELKLEKFNLDNRVKIKVSLLFALILCFYYTPIFAQDSIVLDASISEKKNLNFQDYFFDALTQKGIKNYQKAISSLEECNSIIPNEKAVLFELSKNYLFLNQNPEALEFVNDALKIEADNLWLLEHKVKVLKKLQTFEEAIETQYKIAEKYPKKKREVVYLHLKNKDNASALKVINELADAKLLDARLRRVQKNLTKPKKVSNSSKKVVNQTTNKGSLKDEFNKTKSYDSLKKLLVDLDKNKNPELLAFSEQGMALFPAQPYVYLMNGKANNTKGNFKEALKSLENGIDFVIDDDQLEKQFYTEMIIAYKGLGDSKNAVKYQKKL